jgi:hypothetical protein
MILLCGDVEIRVRKCGGADVIFFRSIEAQHRSAKTASAS